MTGGGPKAWTISRGSRDYPQGVRDLHAEAPEKLYGLGERAAIAALDPDAAVTIVGARRASAYGRRVAEELAMMLSHAGVTVVSGMADGIDAAAHRGALAADGVTVAVLAGGPDVVYPPGQNRLYRGILERGGAAVSEHAPGEQPAKWSFPARNRIMAALARVTVVVEAAERSGSTITANRALRLGRTVGAVPGPVTSRLSAGTNRLIFEGAAVVRDAQDVLDHLYGVGARSVRNVGAPLEAELSETLELIEGGLATCDAIASASRLAAGAVAVALVRLELQGYIRSEAGRYARTGLVVPQCAGPIEIGP